MEVLKLPQPTDREQRVAIVARVSVDGLGLSVGATHLSFRRGEGAAQLDVVLAALAERDGPRLLLGDLNLGPEVVVPAVTAAGYTVAPTEATFPACAPRTRIDFVAVSARCARRYTPRPCRFCSFIQIIRVSSVISRPI